MWAKMPALMIRKVALVSAMREAFSENVGGLYTTDEMDQSQPIDVTPQESREDVLARKQAQIEQFNKEQEQRQKKDVGRVEVEEEPENPMQEADPMQEDLLGNSLDW